MTTSMFDRLEDPMDASVAIRGPPRPMILLGLNCDGLGLDAAVGELWDLIRSYNPGVVFLYKTKMKDRALDKIKWSMGFSNGATVDCRGRSGGLALLWCDGIDFSIRPWSQYYIDTKITVEGFSGGIWRAAHRPTSPDMEGAEIFYEHRIIYLGFVLGISMRS
jgi:hypothetical protein